MTATADELVRPDSEEEGERRTSYLELFFDLVFVFAVTQVTSLVAHDPTARGFAHGALVFGLVWWAWCAYSWMTNAIDVERTETRLLMLAATGGSFFMAISLPDAFGGDGRRFVLAYLFVRVLNVGLYVGGLRGDVQQAAMLKLAPFFLVAPLVAVPGGFVDGRARAAIWLVSLAIDVAGTLAAGGSGFRVAPSHFAERYALFVIIALGESIVAIGVSAESLPRDWTFFAAVSIAFALVAALWWSYFDFPALAAARSLRFARPEKRAPLARDLFTFFHFPNVLGVIYVAVAAKEVIAYPSQPLSGGGRAALGLGIGLFLLQFLLGRLRVIRRVSWERIAGIAAAAVVVVAGRDLDAVWLLGLALAVVVATTLAETIRLGQARLQVRAGGPPVPRAPARRARG
ncbi:MAG TPA: low temperature requirement protein A [Gaiellaceae bacterium]|jgi:low temperature requirement protein LtrA